MPSYGQHSFLHIARVKKAADGKECKCPRTGNTHFYTRVENTVYHNDPGCKCPRTGNTHFYCTPQ